MDFQSLSRRELQALCKINKIPANMTNLAMADALQSLQHVEGMEDFMRMAESEPQSPMIRASGLQDAPRSVCRTATRGRPRTKIDEDVPFTPAAASRSRRAPVAASAAKNTESVACSTRRSVRLAAKQLSALSLNEKERTRPIKIDDMSNLQVEQEDSVMPDVESKAVMEKGSESTTLVTEVHVSEDKVVELYDVGVKCDAESAMFDVKESAVEQVASEEIFGGVVETKEVASFEAAEESDESTVAKFECTLEQNSDAEKTPLEKNGCENLPGMNGMADVEMASDDVDVNNEEDLVVEQPSVVVESVELTGERRDSVALPEKNETKSDCLNIRDLSAALVLTETESVVEELVMTETAAKFANEGLVMAESATVYGEEELAMDASSVPVISNLESKGVIPYSDWAVDSVMGQIPRPTYSTPKKSSRMEELTDINKENVDRSGGKTVHMIEIADERKASTPLDKKSLRKLSKMVREKLQIQKNPKINNCQNVAQGNQLGKSRLALQALPENNQE